MPEPTQHPVESIIVGEIKPINGPVEIVPYDPAWPALFERESDRIRGALGERALRIEHAGSTSVPGLAAKPRIDVILAVADSADEAAYVPDLTAAGYRLVIREPDWFEHRVFKGPDQDINLHTFTMGSSEIDKMLTFRDWLRSHPADRDLYERTKLDLAAGTWVHVQDYADAKTEVVAQILARAGWVPVDAGT
jgi:GrpB-like predicted nucleotidyltransferase (UPF0157 family)